MLAKLISRVIISVFCLAVLCMSEAVSATLSADQYLALRKSLSAKPADLITLKNDLPDGVGKTVELKGVVSGIVSCGGTTSFILDCGESLPIKAGKDAPDCIQNGNTIRVLVTLGQGCTASLSDLRLAGAAYDYEVSRKESPKSNTTPSPIIGRASNQAVFHQTKTITLSSRAASIYDPYRRAIAKFNPRLTNAELDTITTGVLAFSEQYGIDPRLVVALFLAESGFKPNATSPKGAMGLGQLMPGTARGLGVGNAYDPVQNIEASIRLIRGHLGKYNDLALALSAYNAGGGAVKKYGGIPPFRETQNYVRKVSQTYKALCGK